MERWLVLSNCQTFGLAGSFSLLNPSLVVDGVDVLTFKADPVRYNAELAGYDRVIVHPDIAADGAFDPGGARMLNYMPSIEFRAFHPDFGYFWSNETFVGGPMTAYQSVIAIAAFNEGLGLADTRALFTDRTYEACGYHDDWDEQRGILLRSFTAHGVDLSGAFRDWGRSRAFMYSVNHPRIEPVFDIARSFLDAIGMPVVATDLRPMDNLKAGPCLPIYDEVADRLGVNGSYLFKLPGDYRYITLDDFLERSFAVYAGYPPQAIEPHPHYRARYDRVRAFIRGNA